MTSRAGATMPEVWNAPLGATPDVVMSGAHDTGRAMGGLAASWSAELRQV
jgi:hypothetical protein